MAGAGAVAGAPRDVAMAGADKSMAQQPLPAAATSGRLKYADPRSLPSFPSSGLAPNGAAASAAASLGWAKQKPVELWKPDKTSLASTAALLGRNYKMSPSWEPVASSDGHKAALLAVGSAGAALKKSNQQNHSSIPRGSWGNSAATQAFHANRPASAEPPNLSYGSSAATQAFNLSRSKSAKKATSSVANRNDTSPAPTKEAMLANRRAALSALDGAARAHRASMQAKTPTEDAGAVPVTTMTRNMFTSTPPVKLEVDEKTRNEQLHQTAVQIARKMYTQQQKIVDQTKASQSQQRQSDQPSPYLNLQDAAYKQAQERLAKLHDEHMKSREYQEYYGNERTPRRRFTVAAKIRRRLSDSDNVDDRQRSQEIREQMSMFSNKLSQIDREKRERDREALLALAQRNVKARLQGMDEKAHQESGRPPPTRMTEWEIKAQQAAQSNHDTRVLNKGKVDIGGGKFMSPEEVDAIATKKVQPVLDDINEKAETERERRLVLQMEEDARREEGEKQRAREREQKELEKQAKEQEKHAQKIKRHQEKMEEKAKKEEEKLLAKQTKPKTKDETPIAGQPETPTHDSTRINEAEGVGPTLQSPGDSPESAQHKTDSGASPTSKVKGWIKNRFSRGKSMSETGDKRRSFFGGAALKEHSQNKSTTSLDKRSTSMRDVAMAGKSDGQAPSAGNVDAHDAKEQTEPTSRRQDLAEDEAAQDSQGVSPVSTPLEEEKQRDMTAEEPGASLQPPKPITDSSTRIGNSPTRDSRFREEIDT
ncbi:hypothetical protein HIM_05012 [Hirsutella minnesotensis 3608]|uniref:Eisosome protein 1 n=1 Tax=Hirsutella minnesotensis 3608 TaxID=1043627 RepID=A0A0F8A5L7_9HYPO|nr:hypothetical protein HIM_05012 [Hirsutella minnesotensis 3608]